MLLRGGPQNPSGDKLIYSCSSQKERSFEISLQLIVCGLVGLFSREKSPPVIGPTASVSIRIDQSPTKMDAFHKAKCTLCALLIRANRANFGGIVNIIMTICSE